MFPIQCDPGVKHNIMYIYVIFIMYIYVIFIIVLHDWLSGYS